MRKQITDSRHRAIRGAMTVRELREELESYDDDAVVLFACDYGDISHTIQALPVRSADEIDCDERLAESAYSQSGAAIEDEEYRGDGEDDEEGSELGVVILRM